MGGTGVKLKPGPKGGAYIADFLVQQKVPYVFGLCGHGDLGMLDGLYDRQKEIKMISVHHEAIAAFMADGYFRIKQRPVATLSSCGPGSANMVAAIAGAFADSSAMLLITGNVPTTQWNRGPFQESGRFFQGDFITVLRSYVKRSFQPTRGEMLPLAMRQAFALMTNGRPGPVHLDVPLNLFVEPVDEVAAAREADWPTLDWKRPAGDPAAIAQAAKLLLEAERPVIVVGHGVELSNAEAALLAFAEAFSIPVATTPFGKGTFDAKHPLHLGATGRNGPLMANGACRNADVILALGTRFDDRATSAWLPGMTYSFPPTKLIHVDIDSNEIGRNFQPAIGIIGDAKLVLEQLLAYKADVASRRAAWLSRIDAWRKKWVAATVGGKELRCGSHCCRARGCRSAPGGAGQRHRALRRGWSSQLAGLGLGGAPVAHLPADLGLRLDGLWSGRWTRRQAGGTGSSGRFRLRRRRLRDVAERCADGGRVQHPAGVAGVEQLRVWRHPRPATGLLRQDP